LRGEGDREGGRGREKAGLGKREGEREGKKEVESQTSQTRAGSSRNV
jgi:hypothetical protein